MFYCEWCAQKNKWPYQYGMEMSKGPCEDCGKTRICVDFPSDCLPNPKAEPHVTEGNMFR